MRPLLVVAAVTLPTNALADWPEDISLSAMTSYNGVRVNDSTLLHEAYDELVGELGQAIANRPLSPAETLGASGFEFSAGNTFVFLPGMDGDTPSPWERAHRDNAPEGYQFIPGLYARKGLPLSLEVGASALWLGGSHQGVFSAFGRLAVVEGYKPWPDLTFQVGYAGYVGNEELELGVVDLGVTLGSTYAFGSLPGIHQAQISPYLAGSLLLISAAPIVDDATAEALFGDEAADIVRTRRGHPPRYQLGGGFQITNSTVLMKLAATWSFDGMVAVHIGMGFNY